MINSGKPPPFPRRSNNNDETMRNRTRANLVGQNNNGGRNAVRRGWSGDTAAAQRRQMMVAANYSSRENYKNLRRAGSYAQMVILQEIMHTHAILNLSDPHVNNFEAFSDNNIHSSTPNGAYASSFNDGVLMGYGQEVVSPGVVPADNGNMHAIGQVFSSAKNTSPEQVSSITADENVPPPASQNMIQPSLGQHMELQTSNQGVLMGYGQEVVSSGVVPADNENMHAIRKVLSSEKNTSPEQVSGITADENVPPPASQGMIQPSLGQHVELQTSNQGSFKNSHNGETSGVKHVDSGTSVDSSSSEVVQILSAYHAYKSTSANMHNNLPPFISDMHTKFCTGECRCRWFTNIALHFDKCTSPDCWLCDPVRKTINLPVDINQILTSDTADNSEKLDMSHGDEVLEVKAMPDKQKLRGVSLTDYFKVEELKDHLHSFGYQEVEGNINSSPCQNKCQLCAMGTLEFAPSPVYCARCTKPIGHDVFYYQGSDESGLKYCFCSGCYKGCKKYVLSVPKAALQKEKNNMRNKESWVQCDTCKGWQHQICALYNKDRDFGEKADYICPKCWLQKLETEAGEPLSRDISVSAKDLPSSMLSDHIEKRLFTRLKKEREEMAKDSSKNFLEVPEDADFTVRLVSSVDKNLEVNKNFLEFFRGSNYPAEFPYKSKAILLFQRIDGVDVCLFVMYVQEFGSNCHQPNQRCVYISYIDSIKYLRPEMKTVTGEALRTVVYHEIMIAYLDYCRKRGFSTCYIWACPPQKLEDYILYCHPRSQRIPKADKLQQWYELMLKKAVKEDIAADYTNLYDHFFLHARDQSMITATSLPYFAGSYWSSTTEAIICKFEQDQEAGIKLTKTAWRARGHSTSSSDATKKDVLVMAELGDRICKDKKQFIMVHLQFSCVSCHQEILSGVRWSCNKCKSVNICSRCLDKEQSLDGHKMHTSHSGETHTLSEVSVDDIPADTEDNDVIMDQNIFANRESFLSLCQRNNFQFDTLRRAKYSSMMILYHLQNSSSVDK